MTDFGIKVSQLGYDVNTAADFELLLNSKWPLLKIESQGAFSVNRQVSSVVYTHNLNYTPFFLIFSTSGTTSQYASFGMNVGANATHIKYFGDVAYPAGTLTGYYYVFRLPIDQDFEAEIDNTTASTADVDPNFGMKATGPGYDVSSTDLRHFSIHSNTRSPLIQAVQVGTPTEPSTAPGAAPGDLMFKYDHGLGYVPLAFTMIDYGANGVGVNETPGYKFPLGIAGGAQLIYQFVNDTSVIVADTFFSPSTVTASIIVLKDPFQQTVTNVVF